MNITRNLILVQNLVILAIETFNVDFNFNIMSINYPPLIHHKYYINYNNIIYIKLYNIMSSPY